MKKTIAIVLEFGFHEVKKYIHSGFAAELAKEFNIVWLALDKGSKEFDVYFKSTGFPIVYFDEKDFAQGMTKLEAYNQAVRRNWMVNKNLGLFHNHSKVRVKSLKSRFIGNSFFKYIFERMTLFFVSLKYNHKLVANFLSKNNIDLIFLTGNGSEFAKSIVVTAQKQSIKVHYLVNSWKDLFINNFIPYHNLGSIYFWSDSMKRNYIQHMPFLKKEDLIVSGNPTFDVLINRQPVHDRHYYADKYQLPIHAKWLLYSMMPVGIALDEIDTICTTSNALLTSFSSDEVAVLIRKNPTHSTSDFGGMNFPENTRLLEHFCTFDKEKDMILQSPEGETEWLDLLHHCAANLSVPSTVTLEFLTLGKPVFNIAYNANGEIDQRLNQFFEAGFYRSLFQRKDVAKIDTVAELVANVNELEEDTKTKISAATQSASDLICKALKNL